jgi:hypothetical protein
MTAAPSDSESACLALLEAHLTGATLPDLAGHAEGEVDDALRALVKRHGAAAAGLVRRLVDESADKSARKAARRALYRLSQAGIAAPAAPPARPSGAVVKRESERAVRAWLSGIDGGGSRAVWILFEGGLGGGLRLCSLILNDEAGVMESAGGSITRKRLETELASLRESQKLPWLESDPERARQLVAEALGLHERAGTSPPAEFSRWRALFPATATLADPLEGLAADPALVEKSSDLIELPEMLGWFVDPAAIQEQAVARLEMQDSRLIVSDHIKAEREAAIVDAVIERGFPPEARRRWARRLVEMALVFDATERTEPAATARAAAAAIADEARPVERIPIVRRLAMRGLEVGGEVALGRVRLDDVRRGPRA